jgi:hypothetical protein
MMHARVLLATVCAAAASISLASSLMSPETTARLHSMSSAEAPPRQARFSVAPPGSPSELPSGRRCERMVVRSTWEPRPDNVRANPLPRVRVLVSVRTTVAGTRGCCPG